MNVMVSPAVIAIVAANYEYTVVGGPKPRLDAIVRDLCGAVVAV